MKKKRRLVLRTIILIVLATAIIFTLYANFTKNDRKIATVGEKAPDFVLKDLDGHEYRLSDFKGKGVFLNFWGTFCDPCKKEMPYMNNQYKRFKNQGVEIIAVNVGETDLAIETFVNQYNLSFPIVVDNGEVQKAYGIYPLPATFLISPEGKVVDYIEQSLTEDMIEDYMNQIKPK